MNICRRIAPLLDPFMDGELATDKIVEVEQHLTACPRCCAHLRLSAAVCASVRQSVRSMMPSETFKQRVQAALAAEREREESQRASQDGPSRVLPWRVVVPMAAAAAVTLVWAASVNAPEPAARGTATQPMSLAATVDQLIDELVSYHVRAPEPATREVGAIRALESQVGVPLRVPKFEQYGARWEGGGVVLLRNAGLLDAPQPLQGDPVQGRAAPAYARHAAASLRYQLGTHRITVYVYDASRYPLRARLEPRVVHDVPIYVGSRRGYSIAAAERRGVGYAAAADLDDEEIAEIVASTSAQ